jgi:hypothetical protein
VGSRPRGVPAGWNIGPPTCDPGIAAWSVVARSRPPARGKQPVTVTGTGPDETAALQALDDRLRGVPRPDGSRMAERDWRFRLTYLEGAEESSRESLGGGLTEDEMEDVIRRFP